MAPAAIIIILRILPAGADTAFYLLAEVILDNRRDSQVGLVGRGRGAYTRLESFTHIGIELNIQVDGNV